MILDQIFSLDNQQIDKYCHSCSLRINSDFIIYGGSLTMAEHLGLIVENPQV